MDFQATVFEYLDYRLFLKDVFVEKKKDNPHFSIRMVARRLGCDPGFFNRVLNGQRNLSQQYVLKLGDILKLTVKQKNYFELLVHYTQSKKQVEKDHYFRRLDVFRSSKVKATGLAQHLMYSQWYYVVLREMLKAVACRDYSDETCKRISPLFEPKVTSEQIKQAFATLDELGLLSRRIDGTFSAREQFITSGADIPQVVLNRVLMQFMDLAKNAIDRFDRRERSLSTLTFSVSEKGYEKIRERLEQYRREILSLVNEEDESIDRVYHLNMHLFPVTKPYRGKTR